MTINPLNKAVATNFRIFIITPKPKDEKAAYWIRQKENDIPEPLWLKVIHPYISVFYYGFAEKSAPYTLSCQTADEAMKIIEETYYVDYFVHVPNAVLFYPDVLYQHIRDYFSGPALSTQSPRDRSQLDAFLFHQGKYYELDIFFQAQVPVKAGLIEYSIETRRLHRDRPLSKYLQSQSPSHEFISLGGWCGPATSMSPLGIHFGKYPFATIYSTPECILEMIKGNTERYYWEGEYVLAAHYDMFHHSKAKQIRDQINNFVVRLEDKKPILFVRSITSPDFQNEMDIMQELMTLLAKKRGAIDRLLLLLHDQNIATVKVKQMGPNIMIWAIEGAIGYHVSNRYNVARNTARAIEYAMDEQNWIFDQAHVKKHEIINHITPSLYSIFYEHPFKKILFRIRNVTQENWLGCHFYGTYIHIEKNQLKEIHYPKSTRPGIRVFHQFFKLFLQQRNVQDCDLLIIVNEECYVDFDFPVWTFAKRKNDPRNLYLFPFHSMKVLSNHVLLETLHQAAEKQAWKDRKNQVYFIKNRQAPVLGPLADANNTLFITDDWPVEVQQLSSCKYVLSSQVFAPDPDLATYLLSGCCVIILARKDGPYFYDFSTWFKAEEDYILVEYEESDDIPRLISKIKAAIQAHSGQLIAKNARQKAKEIFQLDFIFEQFSYNLKTYLEDIEVNNYSYTCDHRFKRVNQSSDHAGLILAPDYPNLPFLDSSDDLEKNVAFDELLL